VEDAFGRVGSRRHVQSVAHLQGRRHPAFRDIVRTRSSCRRARPLRRGVDRALRVDVDRSAGVAIDQGVCNGKPARGI
jgi:hypothetical protein